MPQINTLSKELVNERRAITTNAQMLRKAVPVRDIDIVSESIISYQGRYVEMTPKACRSTYAPNRYEQDICQPV